MQVVRVRYFNKHGVKKARVALNRHNIFLRDGFQCAYCGSKQNLTLDHILPSSLVRQWRQGLWIGRGFS